MRSRHLLLVTLLLAASGCSDSDSPQGSDSTKPGATSPPTSLVASTSAPGGFTVTSADGDLEVDVPPEALAADPGITIRLLAPDEYPPELAGAADNANSRIYDLGPDGLTFDAPVRVTRRIDAAAFDNLADDMTPLVALVTRAADGTYQAFDDLRVIRYGDDVKVSGTTTHFSPVVSINLEQYAKGSLDSSHLGYATEVGTGLQIGYSFSSAGGSSLVPPDIVEPIGYSRSELFDFAGKGTMLELNCTQAGEARPRIGVRFTLEQTAADGQVGLGALNTLVNMLNRLEMEVKFVPNFLCLDPESSFLGKINPIKITAAVDHPGGTKYIADGNFNGGLSGAQVKFELPYGVDGAWAGLIADTDGDGKPSAADTMYQPWTIAPYGGQGYGYVAPLFGYGNYFVYMIDNTQFSAAPAGASLKLADAIGGYYDNYTGAARFETAFGILSVGQDPFILKVDAAEQEVEADTTAQGLGEYSLLGGLRIVF